MYLKIIVEYGIVGFFIFTGFLFVIFLAILNKSKITRADLMPKMLLSSLVICLAWCFTSLVGVMDMIAFTYGTLLSYYLYFGEHHEKRHNSEKVVEPILRGAPAPGI
jgi:O-antigen ligase